MRKGITLIELLVAVAISLFLLTGFYYFFSVAFKRFTLTTKEAVIVDELALQLEILDHDIEKAGYGIADPSNYTPAEYSSGRLIIRYVDYEKGGCENETFSVNSTCSYEIAYYKVDNGTFYRFKDKGANGTGQSLPLFSKDIKVTQFNATIETANVTRILRYTISVLYDNKTVEISKTIPMFNWNL